MFDIEAEGTDIYGGKHNHEVYKSVAKQLADKFGFEKIAITLRSSISANFTKSQYNKSVLILLIYMRI